MNSQAQTAVVDELVPPGPFREFWNYFSSNRGALIGFVLIVVVLLAALFANFLTPHSPYEQYRDYVLTPPAWQEGGLWQFPLGTDEVGRDILTRLIYGGRLSLFIGMMVVSLSLMLGTLIGLVSGYARGITDTLIMRAMDIIMALPSLLLALAIVTILGPGLINASIAIAVTYLPHYVRITRASVIAETSKDYVIASKVSGAGVFRLVFITILPNCLAPLIVQASLGFSNAILDAAALGFIGLGAQPPSPEWGSMLANALEFIQRAWWVVTFPGLMILLTVLAFNLMGDGLRDALDPKMKL
ncbi:dipeptide transport system permease protein [Desulfuromusa kysingii]|uniref:Dipeptide transport system permease protein n=1 Tax=Desulfuromusa kysingii TaxID=37625 RepID=A0A1H3VHC2_9BACT|nr:ABC transporter permease subunit [Desulfuromusa kysingii]SDZ73578.1 dipeptide transport system permease protein [Desulfuromusa kysingii]